MTHSRFTTATVTCPQCGKTFEARRWRTLVVEENHEAAAAASEGNLTTVKCPHCSAEVELEYPFVLVSTVRRAILHYLPSSADELNEKTIRPYLEDDLHLADAIADSSGVRGEPFTLRFTAQMSDFIEKLMILADGLDDRVVELMKHVAREHGRAAGMPIDHVRYYREGERQLVLAYDDKTELLGAQDFDRAMHDRVKASINNLPEGMIVDGKWAAEVFAGLTAEAH